MITQIDSEYISNCEDIYNMTSHLYYVAHSVVGDSDYGKLVIKYSEISGNILTTRFKLDIVRLINRQIFNKK